MHDIILPIYDTVLVADMDNARVAIIEDDASEREDVRLRLEAAGHSVVAEAVTLREAYYLINGIADGEVPADVILLDGNLQPADDHMPRRPFCEDAREISVWIKERGITSKIIGFSSAPLGKLGIPVDSDSQKFVDRVITAVNGF